jgi:ADP-heptose:LPS heptosyltransferase
MLVNVPLVASLRNNLFSESLRFAYGEDSELSLFVRERGYSIQTVDAKVSHARSQTTNSTPELREKCRQSQEHNHGVNRVRYDHYIRTRRMDYPIVVKRRMALGDVILTTPVIRAIKKSNPSSHLYVETDFPEVFANNPTVTQASKKILPMPDQLVVDLDGSYEGMPQTHILEAYTTKAREVVKGMGEVEWFTELHPSESDRKWASKTCHGITTGKLALIHTDQSHWPGKNVRPELLEEVAHWLFGNGWAVACVGNMNKPPSIPGANLCGQTSILQLAALCQASQLFIGQDSAPLHIAQAAGCPTVPIFGVTSARYITTRGGKCAPVESSQSIQSSGMRHRSSGMTFLKDGKDAMDSITAQDIIAAITRLEV